MNKEMKLGIYNFIKEVNPEYGVKFQKYDLECNVFDEIIYIGETYDKRTDKFFKDFVNKLNSQCKTINPFLLSILHEIGHIETWSDEASKEKDMIYGLLELKYDAEEVLTEDKLEEYCNLYFNIPLEKDATLWGIDYALSHLDLMEKYNWLHN